MLAVVALRVGFGFSIVVDELVFEITVTSLVSRRTKSGAGTRFLYGVASGDAMDEPSL